MSHQLCLPYFLDGATYVNSLVSILSKGDRLFYFVGADNYFSHAQKDERSRRMALALLVDNRLAKACEIERVLDIPHRTLMNWLKQFRQDGPDSFYVLRPPSQPRIFTPEVIARCNGLLAEGKSIGEVAAQTGIQDSTLRKAFSRGTLSLFVGAGGGDEGGGSVATSTTKTERSRIDAQASSGMGTACTRADDRVLAAMGLGGYAVSRFERCCDVFMGGLLVGLPALCANGLLTGIDKHFKARKGFYSCLHVLLTLGFMALGRIRRPEGLRHVPPGELGKVVGLDRVPEVRALRSIVAEMAENGNPEGWMSERAASWMQDDPDEAGYIYVDGHVSVYHGKLASLPRRYVSRDRLCLRGTTDYWVNDALGRPFFVVSKPVTEGLSETLIQDIVPQLVTTVPKQPTEEELAADPLLHRFVVIFDREGAHHKMLAALWQQRIAAITYRKNVKDLWPEDEFRQIEVPTPGGENATLQLAQRETEIRAGSASLPVTEVRCLCETGHQTTIITTARRLDMASVAGRMFARWRQENFFSYMMRHYDIDGLIQYGAESLPGTTLVVNPVRRALDKKIASMAAKKKNLQAKLGGAFNDDHEIDMEKNAKLFEQIENLKEELIQLGVERKAETKKVPIDDLPDDQRPTRLPPLNKILTDTVKMIAFRAETALVAVLKPHLSNETEARAIIRAVLVSSADIEPNETNQTITIRLHRMACPAHDKVVSILLQELTNENFRHPETGAKMIYALA